MTRLKVITVRVFCRNHSFNELNQIKKEDFTLVYYGELTEDYINKQVLQRYGKKHVCEVCNSNQHNRITYSFNHFNEL